jgi:hypothetical protein
LLLGGDAADGPEMVYLYSRDFVAPLKRRSKTTIEVPLYDVGNKQFTFVVGGLTWDENTQ